MQMFSAKVAGVQMQSSEVLIEIKPLRDDDDDEVSRCQNPLRMARFGVFFVLIGFPSVILI